MAKILGQPADIHQLRHEAGNSGQLFTVLDILRSAKRLALKARVVKTKWERLANTPLPAMAENKNGQWVVLARVSADKALIHDPLQQKPFSVSPDAFNETWTGRIILLTRRSADFGQSSSFDLSWFIPAILKYRRILSEVVVASFCLQLFALISPLFFQVVIDKVLVHRGLTTLDVLVIGLVVVSVFEAVLSALRTYIFSHTTNRVDVELGAKLFRHLLGLPLAYFQARRVGDTVARVREMETIRGFLTGSALTLVIDLFFTVVFLAVMYSYSPTLTWIVLATIPFYVLLSVIVTPILRRRLDEKFARGAENQAFLVESVTGVETVKAMAVENQMQRRWEQQLAAYISASFKAANLGNIASQTAQFINKIMVALTLWFGARLVIDNEITVGQLVAFNMLAGRVSAPVLRLAQMWQDFQQVRISVQRLGDVLNTHAEPSSRPNRAALPAIRGDITFEHVNFRYRQDGPEILSDISLSVPTGQIVGFVGQSGSGKSTFAKLIQRLYVPERGRVLIDGVDLAMANPAWLRRQIGVVLQENVLFSGSVRDNIALSDPTLPVEQVIASAKLAGAHEFILELPEGYDTLVGERGNTLSGGQRQRIAIARALVTNPRILIFDEATSALDYESECVIQNNMREICRGRTVLIIAHRLTTVRIADRIVTVEKGRIVEDGRHEELLRKNGRYASLYRHQIGQQLTA